MTQGEALNILKTGRNVFLTGAAGSGKTHTLREYISYLRELGANVAVTASTGIAASHMGGMTIHSWTGMGIKDYLSDSDIEEIAEKKHVRNNIKKADVLILDEISMLHHYRLDMIDKILRRVKGSWEPFGGMQIVLCGDFFQLPPIQRGARRKLSDDLYDFDYEEEDQSSSLFAYNSPAWKNLNMKICYLEEQYRQNDPKYLQVLNAIRDNSVSSNILDILNSRLIENTKDFEISTRLYSHNIDVDSENERELDKVSGKVFEYRMNSRGGKPLVESLKKSCLAPEVLRLKEGAKVMFVKNNFNLGFVNGTLGTVVKLGEHFIRVRTLAGNSIELEPESWRVEEDGSVRAEISQFPLRLAWAITVHKSQGMSLDSAIIDLSDCFEKGMGYVALSRVRSLDGLLLKGINNIALQVSDEVLNFDLELRETSNKNRDHAERIGSKLLDLHEEFKKKVGSDQGHTSLKLRGIKNKKIKINTLDETKKLFESGLSIKEIAKERGIAESTVFDHILKIKEGDPSFNIYALRESMPKSKFKKIWDTFQKLGTIEGGKRPLTPVRDLLGDKFSFDELKIVRMFL